MSGDQEKAAPNGRAIYNPDDDTLRWFNAERFSPAEYAQARGLGFKLWRGSSAWVATWSPEREDFLLGQVAEITFELAPDDPQARQVRFAGRAEAADARANQRRERAMQDLPPFGEPIKVDHHSAKRHRRALERSDQNMRAAFEEGKKADYWRDRAAGAECRARQKSDPGVVRRRIGRLEADLRRMQRSLAALEAKPPTPETAAAWERSATHWQRWAEHLERRLAFEQARLESLKLPPFATAETYQKGDVVRSRRWGKCEVVSAGPKNLKLRVLDGGARGMTMSSLPSEVERWEDPQPE